jgi:hypothetical protein
MKNKAQRKKLIELIREIREAHVRHEPDEELLREAETIVQEVDLSNLCDSDWPAEVIAEYCLRLSQAKRVLNREELLELVRSIQAGPCGSEGEDNARVSLFTANCLHPGKSDLFFYPHLVIPGREGFTAEEIVALALGGKLP